MGKKVLVLLFSAAGFFLAAENLLLNGDFEKLNEKGLPEGWMIQVWRKPGAEVAVVPGVTPGSRALRMTSAGSAGYTVAVQSLSLKNNVRYRLSCYAKCENVRSEKEYDGGIVLVEAGGTVILWNQLNSNRFEGHSFDWRKLEFTTEKPLALPTGNARILVGLRNGTGTVFFDKISLEEIPDTPKEKKAVFRIYPLYLQNNVHHLCRNFPGALLFSEMRIPSELVPGYRMKLTLELPETVTYAGSGTLLNDRNRAWPEDSFTVARFERDGKQCSRYEIDLPEHYVEHATWPEQWANFWRVYLKSSAPAGTEARAVWTLSSRKGTLASGEFTVRILPEIVFPKTPAKKYELCIGQPWNSHAPGRISEVYADYWNRLRDRPWCFDPYRLDFFSKEERDIVFKRYRCARLEWATSSTPWMKPLLAALREKSNAFPPAIGADGKPRPTSISTWYLIEDPENRIWGQFFDEFAEWVKRSGFEAYSLDYEPGAMSHCFSEENRKRFQAFAQLKTLPTPAACLSTFRKQWFAFRVDQHAKIINRMAQKFHEKLPGIEFWLCSDQLHPDGTLVAEWCGVDIRKSDPFVDRHQMMPYFSRTRFFETMKLNIALLKKPCFPLIDPGEPCNYGRYTPDSVIQNVIANAALGGQGIGFWQHDILDGRLLHAFARAFSLISETEEGYCGGKPLPDGSITAECLNVLRFETGNDSGTPVKFVLPPLDRNVRVLLHRADGGFLATVFNFNEKDSVVLKVRIPGVAVPACRIRDLVTGKELSVSGKAPEGALIREGFLLELPPDGLGILKLTPAKIGDVVDSGLEQSAVAAHLKELLKRRNAATGVKPFRTAGSAAEWGMTRPDERPVIRLERSGAVLGLSPETGDVISWMPGSTGTDFVGNARRRGHLGRIWLNPMPGCVDDPASAFELFEFTNRNGLPGAGFRRTIPERDDAGGSNPWAGLRIEKRITLNTDGRSFRIDCRFVNPTKRTIRFSFRMHNFPAPFAAPDSLSFEAGGLRLTPGAPDKEFVVVNEGRNAADFLAAGFERFPRVTGKLDSFTLTVREGELARVFRFVPQSCVALYSWSDMDRKASVEPATEMFVFGPGKTLDWSCVFSIGTAGNGGAVR